MSRCRMCGTEWNATVAACPTPELHAAPLLKASTETAEQLGERACKLFVGWYDSNRPSMDGGAMAYELVSFIRQMLSVMRAPAATQEPIKSSGSEIPNTSFDTALQEAPRCPACGSTINPACEIGKECEAGSAPQEAPTEAAAYGIRVKRDGSLFANIAPVGYTMFDVLMEKMKLEPWVRNGTAEIVPLYLRPSYVAPSTPEGWRLLPEDLVTHLHDWKEACTLAEAIKADHDEKMYWRRQLKTIAAIEALLAAAPEAP